MPSTPERHILTSPFYAVDRYRSWTRSSPFTRGDTWELETGQQSFRCAHFCVVLMTHVKENILVNSAGNACFSDIGFAKLVPTRGSRLKFGWAKVGADGCLWAAPEIFQTGKLSNRSDMFPYGFIAAEVRVPTVALCVVTNLTRYSWENSYGRNSTRTK